jgi:hypothetical protein
VGEQNAPFVDLPEAKNEATYFKVFPLARLLPQRTLTNAGFSLVDHLVAYFVRQA